MINILDFSLLAMFLFQSYFLHSIVVSKTLKALINMTSESKFYCIFFCLGPRMYFVIVTIEACLKVLLLNIEISVSATSSQTISNYLSKPDFN